ncbi:MAG TPA: fibronectin type III domain-containing protein, partial [Thermoplasmata archaeon]|nr:fibronectin type III domain-containing protein [Thermoplasmata archaeon]
MVSVDEIKAFSVRVNWTPYTGTDFQKYYIHVSNSSWDPGAAKKNASSAAVTSANVDRLKPDTKYYAWVKLTLTDGRYAFSQPEAFRTQTEFPYPYNHTGALNVCSLLVLRNGTWFVNGNVTICAGGTLRLENATVVLNSTIPGATGVQVDAGGSLSMAAGRISSRSRFAFSARPGSALDLQDSQIDKVVGGLRVDTDTASFARSRIEDSDDALVVLRGTPALRTISLTNVTRGIVSSGHDLVVEGIWTIDTWRSIDVSGGALVLRDAQFFNCTVGVRARDSEVIAQRVYTSECGTSIDLESSPRTDVSGLTTREGDTGLLAANSSLTLDTFDHEDTDTALDLRNVSGSIRGISIRGGSRGLVMREGTLDVVSISSSETETAVSAFDSELDVFDPRILDATTGFLSIGSNLTVDSGFVTQQNGPCFDLRDSNSRLYYLQTGGGSHSISQSGGTVEVIGSILGGARIGVESDGVFNATDTRVSGAVLYAMSLDGAVANLRQVFLSTGGLAGLKADSSTIWLENSSVAPALRSVTLRKSTLDLLGSSIPGDSVEVDPLSKVRYRWHGTVRVIDHDGAPVVGANVTAEDGPNGTYSVKQVTGETGTIAWLRLLVKETNGTRETNFDPFRFRAWLGPSLQERSLNISGNVTVMLSLVTPPRPVTLHPVNSENIYEDRAVLEWNSTGPGELAWMETQIRESGTTDWEVKENLTEPVPPKFVIFDLAPSTSYDVRLAVHNRLAMAAYSEVRSFTTKPFNHAPELNEASVAGTAYAGVEFAVSVVYRDQDGDPPKYVAFVANGTHVLTPGEIVGAGTRYSGKVTLDEGKYSAYFEADDNRSSPRSKNVTQRINLVVVQTAPDRGLSSTMVAGIAGVVLIAIVIA